MRGYCCLNVPGGWQTCLLTVDYDRTIDKLIGPVFNKINDLWDWQKDNLGIDAYDYNPEVD